MPLSEHEQRLLDEIEQALYAEDPKFAATVRSARSRRQTRTALIGCVAGVLAGLGLVLIGLLVPLIALSVIGFVVLVGSCAYGTTVVRHRGQNAAGPRAASGAAAARTQRSGSLRSRMEDRMRRRFDEN